MRLDEIASDWEAVDHLLVEAEGELTPEIEERIAQVSLNERDKVDSYVFKIKALQGDEASLKKLEEEIAAKRGAKRRLREHLMARVKAYMQERETQELKGNVYRFKYCKNGGLPAVEVLVPPEELPREWQKVTVEADKDAIRESLKKLENPGIIGHVVRLAEPTHSVRIF